MTDKTNIIGTIGGTLLTIIGHVFKNITGAEVVSTIIYAFIGAFVAFFATKLFKGIVKVINNTFNKRIKNEKRINDKR